MSQVLFGDLAGQVGDHHIKYPEAPMELSSRFDQGFPVGQALIEIVFADLAVDFLELHVERHHDISELWRISDFIP